MEHEAVPIIGTLYKKTESIFEAMHISRDMFGFASLDCAPRYGNLADVGTAIQASAQPRKYIRITSKINFERQEDSTVRQSVKQDLADLGVAYLDCYLIHSARYRGFAKTWQEMQSLRRKGIIRETGVSNFELDDISLLPSPYPTVVQVAAPQYFSGKCPKPSKELRVELYGLLSAYYRLPDIVRREFSATCAELGLTDDEGILMACAHEGVIPILGTTRIYRLRRQLQAYDYGRGCSDCATTLAASLRGLYA